MRPKQLANPGRRLKRRRSQRQTHNTFVEECENRCMLEALIAIDVGLIHNTCQILLAKERTRKALRDDVWKQPRGGPRKVCTTTMRTCLENLPILFLQGLVYVVSSRARNVCVLRTDCVMRTTTQDRACFVALIGPSGPQKAVRSSFDVG